MFSFGKKKLGATEKMEKVLRNPKILEVNLIKDEISLNFDWKKHSKGLLIALAITGLIIVELYTGLDWWQKDEEARLEELKIKIESQATDIKSFREQAAPVLAYKEKTLEVGNLLDNHIYWTNFFSWLEKNTLSTVKFGAFSGELNGKYSLSASASSYADVAWQVKTLLEDPLTSEASVELVEASGNKTKLELAKELAKEKEETQEGNENQENIEPVKKKEPGVLFVLTLEVKPEIFKNTY